MIPKFRAWDKETQVLINVLVIDWLNELVDLEGGRIDRQFDEVVLMQSTGLKDKNGVEIFEGDIVKTLGADLEETLSTIKFAEGAFCVDHKNLGTEFEFLYFVDSPLEVVGNIYGNPDLLEVER
ncbi:YopX family protein [Enterococcus mundtii]